MSSGQHGGYFADDRHALYAGILAAALAMEGYAVSLIVDEDGNYTNRLAFPTSRGLTYELIIPEPPEGWKLEDSVRE